MTDFVLTLSGDMSHPDDLDQGHDRRVERDLVLCEEADEICFSEGMNLVSELPHSPVLCSDVKEARQG